MKRIASPHMPTSDRLIIQVARHAEVTPSTLVLYRDIAEVLAAVLKLRANEQDSVVLSGGICSPDIALVIDRVEMEVAEIIGSSPFAADKVALLDRITSGHETVYLANPNRVTGARFTEAELRSIADALPQGTLIVDERYHDFSAVTATRIIPEVDNMLVLRSFTAVFGIATDCGFMIAPTALAKKLQTDSRLCSLSSILEETIVTTLENDLIRQQRINTVHNEMIRIGKAMARRSIQVRLTPTDFILFRVAQPARVCNWLAAEKVPFENLDGYPGMKHYLRYIIQSAISNDRLIDAFSRMPKEYYYMADSDRRPQSLHRSAEKADVKNTTTDFPMIDKRLEITEEVSVIGGEQVR